MTKKTEKVIITIIILVVSLVPLLPIYIILLFFGTPEKTSLMIVFFIWIINFLMYKQ